MQPLTSFLTRRLSNVISLSQFPKPPKAPTGAKRHLTILLSKAAESAHRRLVFFPGGGGKEEDERE